MKQKTAVTKVLEFFGVNLEDEIIAKPMLQLEKQQIIEAVKYADTECLLMTGEQYYTDKYETPERDKK